MIERKVAIFFPRMMFDECAQSPSKNEYAEIQIPQSILKSRFIRLFFKFFQINVRYHDLSPFIDLFPLISNSVDLVPKTLPKVLWITLYSV